MDGDVGRHPRLDVELAEQFVEADPGHDSSQADPKRSILVMDAHRDDRLLEARIADAGHGEEELTREKRRLVHRPRL